MLYFTSPSFSFYPGYQRFFSRAAGIFGGGRRPTHLRPYAKATSGGDVTETGNALEKSLAPRVVSFRLCSIPDSFYANTKTAVLIYLIKRRSVYSRAAFVSKSLFLNQ